MQVYTLANLNPTIELEEYKRKFDNSIPRFLKGIGVRLKP
jgi:hypothetical protein